MASKKNRNKKPRLYWVNAKQRCYNKNLPSYKNYGGRGITMYEPWINDSKLFCDYITSLPNYGKPGLTLDRIDNIGNYEPGNLRWATWKQQANNRQERIMGLRKKLMYSLIKGYKDLSQQELANLFNIHQSTISRILRHNI